MNWDTSDEDTFCFHLPSLDVCKCDIGRGGKEDGRNWMTQFENQSVGICLISSSERCTCISHLVVLLWSLKLGAEDSVKRTPWRLTPSSRDGLLMAVGFVVPVLCMLGKENGSSTSRCSAAQAAQSADSEAQAKAAAHGFPLTAQIATRPQNGKTIQKQA